MGVGTVGVGKTAGGVLGAAAGRAGSGLVGGGFGALGREQRSAEVAVADADRAKNWEHMKAAKVTDYTDDRGTKKTTSGVKAGQVIGAVGGGKV